MPRSNDVADVADPGGNELGRLVSETKEHLKRFVVFPSDEAADAVALWVVHTHLIDHFETTPRLSIVSHEKGSGKTRLLEVIGLLVAEPMRATYASSAVLYRTLNRGMRTILMDECDLYFGRNSVKDSSDMRAIVNSGHRRGASVPRCAPKSLEPIEYPTFAPVALAGIGELHETTADRSIRIPMERRRPDQHVEQVHLRDGAPEAEEIQSRIAAWGRRHGSRFNGVEPQMPQGLINRRLDVWLPLVAIADEAGGSWPATARQAAVHLDAESVEARESLDVILLGELQKIFGHEQFVSTAEILVKLGEEGRPAGLPTTARRLARMLRPFKAEPKNHREGNAILKGYFRADLESPWVTYLPASATSATSASAGGTSKGGQRLARLKTRPPGRSTEASRSGRRAQHSGEEVTLR